jgi:hypothetical protein
MSLLESKWGGPGGLFNLFKVDWLITRQAARLFLVSTIFVLAMTPVFLGRIHIDQMSSRMRLAWNIGGGIGVVSIFFLWIGMWRYRVHVDQSKEWIRRLSSVVLFFGLWWGACFYCLSVYIPQVFRKERRQA